MEKESYKKGYREANNDKSLKQERREVEGFKMKPKWKCVT